MIPSSCSFLKKVTPLFLLCFLPSSANAQSMAVNSTSITLTDNGSKSIQVTATGASAVSYAAAGVPFWLGVTSANGFTTPDTLYFQILNTNCGACSATVTLRTNSGDTAIPVTVTYAPGGGGGSGTLIASSTSLNLSGTPGGFAVTQSVTLSASGGSVTITGLSTDSPSWLVPSFTSGGPTLTPSSPATLSIKGSPAILTAGTYTGHITITDSSGASTTITVVFVVNLVLNATPSSLSFTAASGQPSASQNLTISNPSSTPVSVSVGSDVLWLFVPIVSGSPSSVSNTSPLVISVSTTAAGLTNGTYTGHLIIRPSVGAQITVALTLTVGSGSGGGNGVNGTITADPISLILTAAVGQNATAQNVTLSSTTPTAILGITANVPWLSTTISTGSLSVGPSTPANLSVLASAAFLTAGSYNGQITITPATGTPTVIAVTLTVGTGTIQVDHTSFAFQYPGSTLTSVLNVSAGTSGQSTFTVVVASQNNWLRLSVNNVPAGTYTNVGFGQFTISVDPNVAATLSAGDYTGTLTFINPSNSSDTTTVNLTLTVTAGVPNAISASPSALSFAASPGGAFQSQTLAIMPATTELVRLTVTSYNGAFFTVTSPFCNGSSTFQCSFSGSQSLTIAVNPGNLTVLGTYNAAFLFQSGTSTRTVYLTLTLSNPVAVLTVAPTSLSFASLIGGNPLTQAVSVRVPENASVTAALATSTGNFFTVSANNCNTNPVSNPTCTFNGSQTLYVSVTPGLLFTGSYTGNIALQSAGSTVNLPITLAITSSNTGSNNIASPSDLVFAYQVSSPSVVPQKIISVAAPAGSIIASAIVATAQQWLSVATAGNTVLVSVIPQALSTGTYSGAVSITTSAGTTVVPVTLTVTSSAVVLATPGTVNLSLQASASPVTQAIVFVASDNSAQPVFLTSPVPWITVSPGNPLTTPATYMITVNGSTLCNGLNTASLAVGVSGTGVNRGFVFPVVVLVSNSAATNCTNTNSQLTLSPPALSFTAPVGGPSATQTLAVTASASNTSYTVGATSAGWLSVQPSGPLTGNQTLVVTANPAGLTAGTYAGAITFNTNGVVQTVPVTLAVTSSNAAITVTPAALTFTTAGAQIPPSQTVVISTAGLVPILVTETSSDSPSWLTASLVAGGSLSVSTPVSLAIGVNPTSLAPGPYIGHIIVRTSAGTTALITVNLSITGGLPTVTADQTSVSFVSPGSLPLSLAIRSSNPAITAAVVIVSSESNWLRFDGQPAGTYQNVTLGSHSLSVDSQSAGNLAPGVYTGSLAISKPTNPAEVFTVSVILTVGSGNLALGKTATQSSKVFGYYDGGPAAAIDGNTDGNFFHSSVTHTNADPNAWWQVDLGTSSNVNTIVIWNRTDCCSSRLSDYWVFVSDVPFLATDTPATLQNRAATFASHQSDSPNLNISIGIAARGRYVRIQLSGTNSLSLAEVQVFGTTLTNLSHGRPATQSSTLAGYTTTGASYAVDGNTDGSFFNGSVTHTNTDANAWWQVDLGASAAVTSVTIWNRTDCCSSRLTDYWVFVSDTPFLATDMPATLQNRASTFYSHQTTAPNPSVIIPFTARGRYVRVQLSGTDNLSLAEVEVYGTGGSPAPSNLAQNKLATQSSTLPEYGSTYAGVAVDGNTDGNFFNGSVTHTNIDANAWWQVDLGATQTIGSVVVWNRTDCCSSRLSDYWVFVSDTPFLASDTPATLQNRANTFKSHQTAAPSPSATIPVGSPGRYVRVQLDGTNNLSLAEVQVFGQ